MLRTEGVIDGDRCRYRRIKCITRRISGRYETAQSSTAPRVEDNILDEFIIMLIFCRALGRLDSAIHMSIKTCKIRIIIVECRSHWSSQLYVITILCRHNSIRLCLNLCDFQRPRIDIVNCIGKCRWIRDIDLRNTSGCGIGKCQAGKSRSTPRVCVDICDRTADRISVIYLEGSRRRPTGRWKPHYTHRAGRVS